MPRPPPRALPRSLSRRPVLRQGCSGNPPSRLRRNLQPRSSRRRAHYAFEISVVRGLLENFSLDEIEGSAEFLFETVRRDMVDRRWPGLRQYAEAGEHRLPAFRKKGLVLHGRELAARAKRGDLVLERLRHSLTAGLLPEFAGER